MYVPLHHREVDKLPTYWFITGCLLDVPSTSESALNLLWIRVKCCATIKSASYQLFDRIPWAYWFPKPAFKALSIDMHIVRIYLDRYRDVDIHQQSVRRIFSINKRTDGHTHTHGQHTHTHTHTHTHKRFTMWDLIEELFYYIRRIAKTFLSQ